MKEPIIRSSFFNEKRADGTVYYYAKVAISVNKNFWNRPVFKKYIVYQSTNYSHCLSEENKFSVPKKNESLYLTEIQTQEAISNWLKTYLRSKVISTHEI